MGKQINIFLTAADWDRITAYLDKRGFVVFEETCPLPQASFLPLAALGDPYIYVTNLCLKTQVDQLGWILNKPGNFYWTDSTRSPSISVLSGMIGPNCVYQSQFHYSPDFIVNGERVYKNEEFLEAARIFFNWVRRNFPAREEARGFYASDAALKMKLTWLM